MFGLVELSWVGILFFVFFCLGGVGQFLLYISSSLVSARLNTETYLCTLPGSVLKVPVVGGGGLESKLSDQLWLSFSLVLAKLNN